MQEARADTARIVSPVLSFKTRKVIDLHIAYLRPRNNCTEEGAERCDSDNALLRECISGFGSSVTEAARTDAHYDNSPKRVNAYKEALKDATYLAPSATAEYNRLASNPSAERSVYISELPSCLSLTMTVKNHYLRKGIMEFERVEIMSSLGERCTVKKVRLSGQELANVALIHSQEGRGGVTIGLGAIENRHQVIVERNHSSTITGLGVNRSSDSVIEIERPIT